MALASTWAPTSHAEEFDIKEYSLKAVFLERFTRFIEWPDKNSPDNLLKPFVIGVIDKPKLTALLKKIYQSQKIQNKSVIVRDINDLDELSSAHVIFISQGSDTRLKEITNRTKKTPILTISDTDGYADQGVMINFFVSNDQKVRFEINELAIKQSKLYISYKLLSVARIVGKD